MNQKLRHHDVSELIRGWMEPKSVQSRPAGRVKLARRFNGGKVKRETESPEGDD